MPPFKLPALKTSLEARPTPTPAAPRPTTTAAAAAQDAAAVEPPVQTPRPPSIPDRLPADDAYGNKAVGGDELHIMDPPGAKEDPSLYATSTIYWTKLNQNFPVPEESLTLLPTDRPKPMPRVQHHFSPEPADQREKREARLAQVKSEMKRAWGGYREHAWTHDELSPVSKRFRDPFCGWAATLVDALDTLWIMGMKDEFDDAYAAVKQIDFTTTPFRSEIPVFETIIRYLGGLIAAYDVSGGKQGAYPALLDKAIELAEILMGVFDTPNRMPILYYNWKPAFVSQPQRASSSASVAELGSMSMEFTRLAQLTGKIKYYDAVARITDAFEEWQNRGTALPGIFPQNVDASGCNRTEASASSLSSSSDAAQDQVDAAESPLATPGGYQPSSPEGESKKSPSKGKPDLEFQVTPGDLEGEPAKGEFHKIINKRDVTADAAQDRVSKRSDGAVENYANSMVPANVGYPGDDSPNPYAASGLSADWGLHASGPDQRRLGHGLVQHGRQPGLGIRVLPQAVRAPGRTGA